jgi:hypothetical protein
MDQSSYTDGSDESDNYESDGYMSDSENEYDRGGEDDTAGFDHNTWADSSYAKEFANSGAPSVDPQMIEELFTHVPMPSRNSHSEAESSTANQANGSSDQQQPGERPQGHYIDLDTRRGEFLCNEKTIFRNQTEIARCWAANHVMFRYGFRKKGMMRSRLRDKGRHQRRLEQAAQAAEAEAAHMIQQYQQSHQDQHVPLPATPSMAVDHSRKPSKPSLLRYETRPEYARYHRT